MKNLKKCLKEILPLISIFDGKEEEYEVKLTIEHGIEEYRSGYESGDYDWCVEFRGTFSHILKKIMSKYQLKAYVKDFTVWNVNEIDIAKLYEYNEYDKSDSDLED